MLCALIALCRAEENVTDSCMAYNNSCMLCMQHKDECFFCFDKESGKSKCLEIAKVNNTKCEHISTDIDQKCIEMLGGDAVAKNRYIIGGCVLAIGLVTDIIVRFCSRKQIKDEYAHL